MTPWRGGWFQPARPAWTRRLTIGAALLVALVLHPLEASAGLLAANLFQTVDWMSMQSLLLLTNKCAVVTNMTTEYEEDFSKAWAPGDTIRVKKPQRWTIRNGLGYSPQGVNRQVVTVTCNQIFGIDFEWDGFERAVKMERSRKELSRDYLEPAMSQIAQEWDSRGANFAMLNANNIVGTVGTDPTDFDSTSAAARQRLVELGGASDDGDRCIYVPPNIMRALKKSSLSFFNPVTDLIKQWRTGIVGSGDGFEWYESMSLYSYTTGQWATPAGLTLNAAPASGATSITIAGTTNGDQFNQGDVLTMAGANQVNPMTRRKTTSVVKPFVITAPITATGSTTTVSISPALNGPGSQYQNVDALPASGAVVTMFPGTTFSASTTKAGVNSLAFTKHGFAWVSVPMEMPEAAEVSWQKRDPETGATIAFLRMMDPVQRKMINRFDCLGGFGALYADECAVRLLGA